MPTINNRFENLTLERLQEIYDILSTSPPGAAVWGTITGTLSAQTDLQSALNAKYNVPIGTISQYIRGDGSLATFPTIPTVTPSALTKTDDTNVTLTLGGTPSTALLQAVSLTLGWTGTLADSRIASASTWNAKQNAITLTTTGTTGAATLVGSTLNIPQYSNAGTTVYVANANSVTFANGAQFSVYLGGTPVNPVQITAGIYGATSTDFMPGYPMPAGVASKTRATLRSANPATNALEVYVANATTSTRGAVLTIPAGSAAGIYTADDNTTVSFTIGQRLYFMVRNPNVVGGAASGQISTLSFNYTLS